MRRRTGSEREKGLRNTRIRNFHEMEELKRAQEMQIDEFSRQELRERKATIHELISQIQDLQEKVNCMNDSREFQDVESILQWKIFSRSQSTSSRSKSSIYVEQRPEHAT